MHILSGASVPATVCPATPSPSNQEEIPQVNYNISFHLFKTGSKEK